MLHEGISYKPPMTAVRSGIKYENGEAIFIGNAEFSIKTVVGHFHQFFSFRELIPV